MSRNQSGLFEDLSLSQQLAWEISCELKQIMKENNIIILNNPEIFEKAYQNIFKKHSLSQQNHIQWLEQQQQKVREKQQRLASLSSLSPSLSLERGYKVIKREEGQLNFDADVKCEEIIKYYNHVADLFKAQTVVSCVDIAAKAWSVANTLIGENKKYQSLTVNLCTFKNWTHDFISIQDSIHEDSLQFYDPWATLIGFVTDCTLFSPENFGVHIQEIKQRSDTAFDNIKTLAFPAITKNTQIYSITAQKQIPYHYNDDYGYHIACSTGEFTNPAELKQVINTPTSSCLIL